MPKLIARRAGREIRVKRILVLEVTENPELFTSSIDDILNDPEITMAAEAIGGVKAAYPYVKALLASGRSVVTSNKELVATHGAELLALAKENGVAFLFEASVGGGMPLITPMCQSMLANQVKEVYGIVNGTTNYMLTRMSRENMDFSAALKEAQRWATRRPRIPRTMWTARTPVAKLPFWPALLLANRFTPGTFPPGASGGWSPLICVPLPGWAVR